MGNFFDMIWDSDNVIIIEPFRLRMEIFGQVKIWKFFEGKFLLKWIFFQYFQSIIQLLQKPQIPQYQNIPILNFQTIFSSFLPTKKNRSINLKTHSESSKKNQYPVFFLFISNVCCKKMEADIPMCIINFTGKKKFYFLG